jgi:probable O-glycosylation ligase (exosortase A-associated)
MRDYVLTLLIVALLPVCVWRPWIGVLVWYWFGLMNPHRLTWDFAYSMPFAAWIGGATLVGAVFAKDRKPLPWNVSLILLAILMAYYTLTTFFAWVPDEAWEQWRKVMKIVLMTFVATMFIYGKDRIYALMLTVALSIGFYGVKGFFFVLRSGGAEHVQGPEGSFITGNTFLGLALTMVLPVMVCLAREEERRWLRNLLYSAAAMTGVSTVFTYSRGAFLGLGAVLPLLFVRSKRKWLAVALLVPALFIVPALLPESVYQRAELIENYETDRSANMRLQSWTVAWNLARDNPLTGAGFNFEYGNIRDRWLAYGSEEYEWALRRAQAAHSIYFQVLGQHGFVALGLFLALLVGTWVSLGRLRSRASAHPELGWLSSYASGLQIGLVGYMVTGAFLSSAYFDLAYLYYAFAAILWRDLRTAEERGRTAPTGPALGPERVRAAPQPATAVRAGQIP